MKKLIPLFLILLCFSFVSAGIFDISKGTALEFDEECEKVFIENEEITSESCSIIFGKIVCENVTTINPIYENINCQKIITERTIYPHKKTEEGVELGMEIDVLRQAVYELNERLKVLENKK